MSYRYEVFDADEVQFNTRQKVTRLSGVVAAAVVLTVLTVGMSQSDAVPLPVVGAAVFGIWLTAVWWISRRLRRLRRVVWCVKLSDSHVMGYDYARRTVSLEWRHVQRVEITDADLRIVGSSACSIHIPSIFPAFAALSHQAVEHAEQHGVPVHLHGQPYEDLDVYVLFPTLAEDLAVPRDPSPGSPGAARGSAEA